MDEKFLKWVIEFILKADHVNHLSWETRRMKYTVGLVQFPILVRKISVSKMWRNFFESVAKEPIKTWAKDVLDGDKLMSVENEEGIRDDICGQKHHENLKPTCFENCTVHRNVDDVLMVGVSESVNNESCGFTLQNGNGNGIVQVRGSSDEQVLSTIVDEDEPHCPRTHGRTENNVNLCYAENGQEDDLNLEIPLPYDKIRTKNGRIQKKHTRKKIKYFEQLS